MAPASSKALLESYSQFVPGNTGINTLGCANFVWATILHFLSLTIFSIWLNLLSAFVGNTFSKGSVYKGMIFSKSISS